MAQTCNYSRGLSLEQSNINTIDTIYRICLIINFTSFRSADPTQMPTHTFILQHLPSHVMTSAINSMDSHELESILLTSNHHSDSDSIRSEDSEAFSPRDFVVEDALSPATDYETFEKSPFVPHSPEAIQQIDQNAISDRSRSNSSDPNESTFFVRRSMLENRRKRKRPSCCSLSILEPGTSTRKVIHIEEVPITCKRLIIRHQIAGYEKVIELPEILATAPKRIATCQTRQVKEEAVETTMTAEIIDEGEPGQPPGRTIVATLQADATVFSRMVTTTPDTSQYNFTVL